ncbi:MAG: hypothetical protein AB7L65_04855 [Hyphomonadaceae bacterium]
MELTLGDQELLYADVVGKLRAAAHADRTVDAAQIHLINIQDIIRSAGVHWQKMKDRIRTGSMTFLIGSLWPNDIVIPCGDGFLIIYARGDPAQLARRSAELQGLLTEFYCGQAGLETLKVEVHHQRADADTFGDIVFASEATHAAADEPGDTMMFLPVWSPQIGLIASYCCAPLVGGAASYRFGYDANYRDEGLLSERDFLARDLAILERALHALASRDGEGPHPAICATVHSSTMQSRVSRGAYLARLRDLPANLIKYFVLKISEIERGAPITAVADWTGVLRTRVGHVVLEFHRNDPVAPALDQTGAWGAGFALSGRDNDEHGEGGRIRQTIRAWGETLERRRMRFFVDNARTPGIAQAAADAGAHFVTSEALWPAAPAPQNVRTLSAPFQSARQMR